MAEERFIDEEPIEGTNQVTKVWDATFLLPRAVRALPVMGDDDAEAIRQRVRALSRVRHPALPPLVAVGGGEGAVKLVESWVDGRSLEQIVEEDGAFSVGRSLALLSPIVDALRSTHELGIGHGGVDARSLLVDRVGVPQVVGLGARDGSPADDISDLGFLMSEVIADPWPDTLRSLIDEAMGGQIASMEDIAERLRLISADLADASEDSELSFDFDFDFDFDPNEVMYDEAAVAGDRRVLAMVALGVLAILGVGIYGTFLPDDDDPLEVVEDVNEPDTVAEVQAPAEGAEPAAEVVADEAQGEKAEDAGPGPRGRLAEESSEARDGGGAGDPEPEPRAPGGAEAVAAQDEQPLLPPVGPMGKWQYFRPSESPGLALLDAENEVQDRLDRPGRPQLALVCRDHGLSVELRPGVHRVEATADERTYELFAMVELSRDGLPADPMRAELIHHDGNVYLPPERFRTLLDAESVMLRYAVFAGEPVVALFDVRGMDRALGQLSPCS